jgi:hypothetical protein
MPQDIYPTRSFDNDASIQLESRQAFALLLAQGYTDAMGRFAFGFVLDRQPNGDNTLLGC